MVSALRVFFSFIFFFVVSMAAAADVESSLGAAGASWAIPGAVQEAPKLLDTNDDEEEDCDGGLLPAPVRLAAIVGVSLMAGGSLAVPTPKSSAFLMSF